VLGSKSASKKLMIAGVVAIAALAGCADGGEKTGAGEGNLTPVGDSGARPHDGPDWYLGSFEGPCFDSKGATGATWAIGYAREDDVLHEFFFVETDDAAGHGFADYKILPDGSFVLLPPDHFPPGSELVGRCDLAVCTFEGVDRFEAGVIHAEAVERRFSSTLQKSALGADQVRQFVTRTSGGEVIDTQTTECRLTRVERAAPRRDEGASAEPALRRTIPDRR